MGTISLQALGHYVGRAFREQPFFYYVSACSGKHLATFQTLLGVYDNHDEGRKENG
jgi:hypothetical protein